jgi:hypothetical protein
MTVGGLILKRAPIGWNQDDFDVVEDGVIVGRIFKVPIAPAECPLDVDERTQRPHTPRGTRLLADARGRDDGVRQELAERLSVRSAVPTRKVVVSDQSCACLR